MSVLPPVTSSDPARPSRRRRFALALSAGLVLLVGGGAAGGVTAASGAPASVARTCSTAFFDGDARLGPAQLQTVGLVAPMLAGYDRLAGLSPQQFIDTYWDPTANGGSQ